MSFVCRRKKKTYVPDLYATNPNQQKLYILKKQPKNIILRLTMFLKRVSKAHALHAHIQFLIFYQTRPLHLSNKLVFQKSKTLVTVEWSAISNDAVRWHLVDTNFNSLDETCYIAYSFNSVIIQVYFIWITEIQVAEHSPVLCHSCQIKDGALFLFKSYSEAI